MSDDLQPKEGEVLPAGEAPKQDEMPAWIADLAKVITKHDLKKTKLKYSRESQSEWRYLWIVGALFAAGIIATCALYITDNRGDAFLLATHALAFGVGASTNLRSGRSSDD